MRSITGMRLSRQHELVPSGSDGPQELEMINASIDASRTWHRSAIHQMENDNQYEQK